MTDHAFNRAQASYDAAEPDDDELPEPDSIGYSLDRVLEAVYADQVSDEDSRENIHVLSDRQATAAIWIDGHEYSLTLNRED